MKTSPSTDFWNKCLNQSDEYIDRAVIFFFHMKKATLRFNYFSSCYSESHSFTCQGKSWSRISSLWMWVLVAYRGEYYNVKFLTQNPQILSPLSKPKAVFPFENGLDRPSLAKVRPKLPEKEETCFLSPCPVSITQLPSWSILPLRIQRKSSGFIKRAINVKDTCG